MFFNSPQSIITVLTVVLNLLVIISVSHFRQLHTTTNLLTLSLAVADFLVGFLQMPVEILLYKGCWTLGDFICAVKFFLGSHIISASVGNMVLIAIDRYIAICDQMFYSTKVTLKRIIFCICLCWILSALRSISILVDFLSQQYRYNFCNGECVTVIRLTEAAIGFFVSFLGPITVIIVLYIRVFVVAVSQARAMRSHITAVTVQRSEAVKVQKSEIKAARTLGVVVVVFLLCYTPYCSIIVAVVNTSTGGSTASLQYWLLYCNSCLNPLIYAFFYPGSENL
ncbi:trace amine-associated receptor 1-like [Mastacembelus armatus]|uniref:trace amine-associated receptor 1-like n=1 Tax=Mastacembelus armatus TaxID=205130 RepID=UPI000E46351D|nr:trace amine-associated receptor 1-like [Mastacembelus armatus]